VDRLDGVSRKYTLLINVDKTEKDFAGFADSKENKGVGNGERRQSVPHPDSEWATGADGYVPVPWVPDYRRW